MSSLSADAANNPTRPNGGAGDTEPSKPRNPRLLIVDDVADNRTILSRRFQRRNFEVVSKLVVPGDPLASKLLKHPLAQDAGGDLFHSGGRQFTSQSDPDWLTIADWIRAAH